MKKIHYRLIGGVMSIFMAFNSAGLAAYALEPESLLEDDAESVPLSEETQEPDKDDSVPGGMLDYSGLEKQLQDIEADTGNAAVEEVSEPDSVNESGSDDAPETEEKDPVSDREILTDGSWQYFVDDSDYAHIVSFTNVAASEVTVPVRLGGHFVVALEDGAFGSGDFLSSVTISFYVTSISENAFSQPVTIKAYHGSYALSFAESMGYPSMNLSELDFAYGVMDFSEIMRSHYSFISRTTIEMMKPEAYLLGEGSVFYLPQSEEVPNGDAFKVITIEDNGDSVLLKCERALGSDVLKTLVIHDHDLKLDFDNAIYYFDCDNDGTYESYEAEDVTREDGSVLMADIEWGLEHTTINVTPYENELEIKEYSDTIGDNLKYKVEAADKISLDVDIDINLILKKINEFEISFSNETYIYGEVEGEYHKDIPIATIPFQTTGIEEVGITIFLCFDVNGEVSLKASVKEEGSVKYVNGKFEAIGQVTGPSPEIKAEVNGSVYLKEELGVQTRGLIDAKAGVFAAEGLRAEIDLVEKSGEIFAFGRLGAELEIELLDIDEEPHKDFEFRLKKLYLSDIISNRYNVRFSTGKALASVKDQTVKAGETATEPELKSYGGYVLEGWYQDITYTRKWNFSSDTVDRNLTLYAKWEKDYKVTFKAAGLDDYYADAGSGQLINKPADPKRKDYIFKGWFKDADYKREWDFEKDKMPENDLVLYGRFDKFEGYDPWTGTVNPDPSAIGSSGDYSLDVKRDSDDNIYVEIKEYVGPGGAVTIPENINGYPVRKIDSRAFIDNTAVTSLVIPGSVTEIGESALEGCTSIKSITSAITFDRRIFGIPVSGEPEDGNIPRLYPLTRIEITGGTKICDSAFKDFDSLEEVAFTGELKSVGDQAFAGCSNLKKVTGLKGVSTIGNEAFADCYSLSDIALPDTLSSIGAGAFKNCVVLTDLVFPASIEYIGRGVLEGCTAVSSIEIPFLSYTLSDLFGIEKASEYELEYDEVELEQYSSLKKVIITKGTTVPMNAFCGWKYLEEVQVPAEVTTIEHNAFKGCGIKEFTFPDSLSSISMNAFEDAFNLKSVFLPPVNTIDRYAFKDCTALEEVTFTGATSIKECFPGCDSLMRVVVHSDGFADKNRNSVLFDDEWDGTIYGYGGSKTETLAKEKGYKFADISGNPVYEDSYGNFTIDTSKGYVAITGYSGNERQVSIPSEINGLTVKEISEYAFKDCGSIKILNLPDTIAEIGKLAFWNTKIEAIYGPVGNAVINSYMKSYSLPYNRYKITLVYSDKHRFTIHERAGELLGEEVKNSIMQPESSNYTLEGFNLGALEGPRWNFDTDRMPAKDITLYAVWNCDYTYTVSAGKVTITGVGKHRSDYVIPESIDDCKVVSIASGAFAFESIKSVTIPATVTSIADSSFNSDVTIISDADSYAKTYADAHGLSFAVRKYPLSFEVFGGSEIEECFYAKDSTVKKPSDPIKDNYDFYGWYKDKDLSQIFDFSSDKMPGKAAVLYAGWRKNNEAIPDMAFAYKIVEGKVTITGYTGSDRYLVIPEKINGVTVSAIADEAFYGCSSVKELTIPDTVTAVGAKAFYGCEGLESVSFGSGLTSLGRYVFGNCGSLNAVDMSGLNALKDISEGLFIYDSNLYQVNLPAGITTIGAYAFAGCTYMQEISVPSSVTAIGENAFSGCFELTIKGYSKTAIEKYAIDNELKFEYIDVPDPEPPVPDPEPPVPETDDWGDIKSDTIKAWFGNDVSEVPDGVWYVWKTENGFRHLGGITGDGVEAETITREYTGNRITLSGEILVFHNTRRLVENRDYTISYRNNVNAATANAAKAPVFAINGKGTYNGSNDFKFCIEAKDMASGNEVSITSEKHVVVMTGKKVRLGSTVPAVVFNGKKLTLNKDYALEYYKGAELIEDPAKEMLTTAGETYTIKVCGLNKAGCNFKGELQETVEVVTMAPAKNVVQVTKLKAALKDGKAIAFDYMEGRAINPIALFSSGDAVVMNGKKVLAYGDDYSIRTVDTEDYTSAGRHEFVIVGTHKGAEELSKDGAVQYVGEKTLSLEIRGKANIAKARVAGLKTTVEYLGRAFTVEDLSKDGALFNAADKKLDAAMKGVTLYTVSGKTKNVLETDTDGTGDYVIEMADTGVVGRFDIIFKGVNGCTGTLKKTINVKAVNLKNPGRSLTIHVPSASYVKSGARPSVTVKLDEGTAAEATLEEGVDYTVTYKNNNKLFDIEGKTISQLKAAPTVVIRGMGNYTGSNASAHFSITEGDSDKLYAFVRDIVYNKSKSGKSGYFLIAPKIMEDGKALATGKNREAEAFKKTDCSFTYCEETCLEGESTPRSIGSEVYEKDKIPAGTKIKVSVNVTLPAGSPYNPGKEAVTKTIEGFYRVVGADIGKVKIAVNEKGAAKLVAGSGKTITLEDDDLTVILGSGKNMHTLTSDDYEVVNGTAGAGSGSITVTIAGKGNYGGTKSQTFKIRAKSLK